MERAETAHKAYLENGLGARNDADAMQYLFSGWTFDNKKNLHGAVRREKDATLPGEGVVLSMTISVFTLVLGIFRLKTYHLI